MGHPVINGRWQGMVVLQIELAAARPEITEETLALLRDGLIVYTDDGGGATDPVTKSWLAQALLVLGGPAHPECDEVAAALMEDATAWAAELESDVFIELVEKTRRRIEDIGVWKERLSRCKPPPKREKQDEQAALLEKRQESERMIRALSLGDRPTSETVEKAAKLATQDFGQAAVNEDMIARLLIACRMTLDKRKGIRKAVIKTIDQKLLWLARDARKLTCERHWSLWAEAVSALGPRASRAMRRYVYHDGCKEQRDPLIIQAINKAQKGLRNKKRLSSLTTTIPTSQPH